MEKLELQHLAPYLPYELRMKYDNNFLSPSERLLDIENYNFLTGLAKPILRPLSDLTKEISHDGEKFVPIIELYKIARGRYKDSIVKYWELLSSNSIKVEMEGHLNYIFSLVYSDCDMRLGIGFNFELYSTDLRNDNPSNIVVQCCNILIEKLFEWHFDVFGLIEQGLAIDINTL